MKPNGRILLWVMAIALIAMAGVTQRTSAQDQPVPPPSAPPQLSEDDLEKLVAPIALCPDPLLSVMLPASAYPLEVVQAARFVQNLGNVSQLDDQPWDDNVKAVAKFPTVIEYMDTNLQWTIQLGNAFVDQQMDVMNAIQVLRTKAQSLGTLQNTAQQLVIVTNAVVERDYQDQVIYVTNTVVEIQPANPEIIYVPVYNPIYVYYPPPGYVYYPYYAPPVYVRSTFISYRCDWYYGGVYFGRPGLIFWNGRGSYHPPYYPPPPGYHRPPPFRAPPNYRPPPSGGRPPGYPPPQKPPHGKPGSPGSGRPPGGSPGQPGSGGPSGPGGPPSKPPSGPGAPPRGDDTPRRWQPDQNRRQNPGSPSGDNSDSRGWRSQPTSPARPGNGSVGILPAPEKSAPEKRPAPGGPATGKPTAPGNQPGNGPGGNRPGNGNNGNRPTPPPNTGGNRPSSGNPPSNNRPSPPPASGNRREPSAGSGDGAFDGVGKGSDARNSSNRGAASRGGGSGGNGGGGRSGGGTGSGGARGGSGAGGGRPPGGRQ